MLPHRPPHRPSSVLVLVVFGLIASVLPSRALAQDTLEVRLPDITIDAARGSFTTTSAPVAVAVLTRTRQTRSMEPALAIENVLTELPGLWIADRSHLAIGERLVVRGLGSRAAFGVRSIAVLLDGVLLTMPDGQAVLDPIEPSAISRAELIRGPSSRFWGNAAGGVLSVESLPVTSEGFSGGIRTLVGSLGSLQATSHFATSTSKQRVAGYASILDRTGYRDHAAGSMLRVGVRTTRSLGANAVLNAALHASDLDTESPGSLTLEQWEDDAEAADSRYVDTRSGKKATQVQASLGITTPLAGGVLSSNVFGLSRSLDNPLPFAWIGLERAAVGARTDWRISGSSVSIGIGADARRQTDDRINTNNADGGRGENLRLDQEEVVTGLGASMIADLSLPSDLTLSAGLRIDRLAVEMTDHLVENGDQSGSESFLAASPSLGFLLGRDRGEAYASFSTAFEIPTTTELVNRPDGLGGFNPDLEPQRITGLEAGFRSTPSEALSLDVAAYVQSLTNFLSPFQLEEFEGRTFYRNVGRVEYVGLEVAWSARSSERLMFDGTASVHRYEFASGDLEGSRVPGIPMRFGSVRATWTSDHGTVSARLRVAASQFANDGNSVEVDGFTVLDLRLGGRELRRGDTTILPYLEVSNALDRSYVGSIIPNARGGRYYEGAPGRAFRGGLAVSF